MLKSIIAIAALGVAGTAQAAVLFEDNFDGYPTKLTTTDMSPNWTVTGNVDVVNTGTFSINCDVKCVDLDGTRGPGQILSKPIAFSGGSPVVISFDMSGNQRGGASDQFEFEVIFGGVYTTDFQLISGFQSGVNGVLIGNSTGIYSETVTPSRAFVTYGLSLNFTTPGTMQLRFATTSADNVGPVLDNVLVTQTSGVVPEPATWAMLIAGFGMVGSAMRRRRTAVAA